MKINSENIEALIVDYFDGALNEQQSKELERAVAQNAEFRGLFDEYRSAFDCTVGDTKDTSIQAEFAMELKHTSDFDEMDTPFFDRLAVLVTEGIATEAEKCEYNNLVLNNDANLSSAVLYSNCKILDNKDIQCPYKQTLKHSRIRPLWYAMAAAAAVSAFFFMFRMMYAPAYNIDSAVISGNIALDFNGRDVYAAVDNNIIEDEPKTDHSSVLPKMSNTIAHTDETNTYMAQPLTQPSINQIDTIKSEMVVASIDEQLITYPEETMLPVAVDWDAMNQSDRNGQVISMDFIGEQGIADIKDDAERIRNRWNQRRNPKICVSYDEDGKKDGISLLIGNKEVRVWSR